SANLDVEVCLIEAGGKDTDPRIHVPLGFAFLGHKSNLSWNYDTEPQEGFEKVVVESPAAAVVDSAGGVHKVQREVMEHRKGFQPRGKTLGGSSSINAMLYVRGHRWDYNHWAELGNAGWSYDEVLPYFKKAEHNEVFDNAFHGQNGPLNVCKIRHSNKPTDQFVNAGSKLYPYNDDFNGAEQEGIGYYQTTQKDGKRCSTAKAYLVPAMDRPNLTVLTNTQVNKLLLEGDKVIGVQCITRQQAMVDFTANKEVVLSAGAFGSPQILLRSGIGAAEEITKHNIEHLVDLPGVGKNLQDHLDYLSVHNHCSTDLIGMSWRSIFYTYPWELLKYLFRKTGLFTSTVAEAGGFIRTSDELDVPDVQLHFAPAMVVDHGRTLLWGRGLSCHVCLLRPKSRGTVRLQSADPHDNPLIDPKFLSHPDDIKVLVKGYKKMMAIMRTGPISHYLAKCVRPVNIHDDRDIERAIRESADTVYHPVGTCKMGSDSQAVVDERLRVRKVQNLRVVDASTMPTVVGGNTNAPTVMIGEKAAEMILQDWLILS
ncbi:GMC family oxidoreductase N-terminal domain-containing protein, partial [Gammaproteobacteria bacterium]|nr:GMC family oxidoreductase N-terminal domain-containing protein [Gammaproteobacteria bacterium]